MAQTTNPLAPAGLLSGSTVRTKFAAWMLPVRSGPPHWSAIGQWYGRRKATPPRRVQNG
jgi:hypothetical protein